MRFLYCLLVFLFSFGFVTAQSEQLVFSKLDIYDGLSHNQVTAIHRDKQGFLWYGTMSGLNRYDGYSFRVFRNKPGDSSSIPDNYISAIYELPGNKLWVMTREFPCIYDARTEKFSSSVAAYLQSLGLPGTTPGAILKGATGNYWFQYDSTGWYLYNDSLKTIKSFSHPAREGSTERNRITAVNDAKDGSAWFLHEDGLITRIDLQSGKQLFTSISLQTANPGIYTYNFFVDSSNDLWIWTANSPKGVFLYSASANAVRLISENTSPAKLSANLITGIIQDSRGNIWIATDHGGINLIDKKNFEVSFLTNDPKDARTLSQNSITTIYKDNNGVIWMGTFKQGVNYLNENIEKFAHYHHQESNPRSLQYDDVNRFVEDRHGNIWIGTNGGGLIYFNRANNTFKQYLHDPQNNNSLSNNVVVSLYIDHEDKLWIGTYFGGLSSFDGKQFTHYRHSTTDLTSLADDRVWEIVEDSDKNLWIGTLDGGLDLFDRKTNKFLHHQFKPGVTSPLQSNYVSSIVEDRKGNLWIGTAIGVTVFPKSKSAPVQYQHTEAKNSLSNNNVISILEDSKGRIWIGTREGLNLWNETTKGFETFTISDGLPDNTILTIVEDQHQSLWISTPSGLCNAVPQVNGDKISFSVIHYDEMNNLQGLEFNENAALRTSKGEMIFGGPAGFNIIQPSKIRKTNPNADIVFTSLQIFNNTIEAGEQINNRVLLPEALPQLDEINLKYKENVFSIEFASLDFSHSSRDKYAYMLEGFNSEWLFTDGNQRRITYTNLDPGNYTFKVKMLNNSGIWSPEKILKIHVSPPFWRTPIAFILYFAIIVGLLLLARKITLDRAHMRFEVQQQRREAERVQAVDRLKTKFFTNVSHEFRTPLSLIISPLDRIIRNTEDAEQKKQLHLVHRNAKRLLNLVNQLLDFRKMEVQEIQLHPAIGDIVQFVKDISYSFTDIAEKKGIHFSFESSIDSLEIFFDRDKIEKILFNLLSNAFKYTPDNGSVSVRLSYESNGVQDAMGVFKIQVADTGIGIPKDQHDRIFERFFQSDVPQTMVNQGTGIGLAITREFVKLHNGTISIESEPEKGSCFTVSIPARKIHDPVQPVADADAVLVDEELDSDKEVAGRGRRKTVLLVEDNEDLRFYLKDNLKLSYHVEEAVNGKEGWEKAKKIMPDLIVSDIMMPLMNGLELASKIKNDTITAHIPIVLLTAMGSAEKQLEGFELGVNDYITKPFTFEILASRIKNLLAQQKLLQKKFQKQIEVNPGDITVTPLDEQFIKQALAVVEKNMDNPDFSVEEFSRDMAMSRVALYKKIISLTGKAPLDFIRSIRLKRAAQLLEKSGLTISEIAYEVGFNNPKLFSRSFKEEFKILPSQYMSDKKQQADQA